MDVIAELNKRLKKCSQKELAAEIGVSAPFLNRVLMRVRPPGAKILTYLGVKREVTYTRSTQAQSQ